MTDEIMNEITEETDGSETITDDNEVERLTNEISVMQQEIDAINQLYAEEERFIIAKQQLGNDFDDYSALLVYGDADKFDASLNAIQAMRQQSYGDPTANFGRRATVSKEQNSYEFGKQLARRTREARP